MKKLILLSILFMVSSTTHTKNNDIATLKKESSGLLALTFNTKELGTNQIQSYTHFSYPGLQNNLLNTWALKTKIPTIGTKEIQNIIDDVCKKEKDLSKTHYVFYHGCKLDFMLFQDILKLLTEITIGKNLTDFFLLRVPSTNFSTDTSTSTFLQRLNYKINDSQYPARDYLLSVNPALFGNNLYRETSSAFCYFLESRTAFWINPHDYVWQAFNHYNADNTYNNCYNEILDLYYLLTTYDIKSTGILLQIFIPKESVNDLVYRALPRGIPFYAQDHSSKVLPSIELDQYQNNKLPTYPYSADVLDTMQFRVLLSNNGMLDITNSQKAKPIKIFRYFNQTTTTKTYQTKFEQLKIRIKKELKKI